QMHTPYGATEALPVATIAASEVLSETAEQTDRGAGVCVGTKFDSVDWRVICITDRPLATIDDAEELPRGEIGELIVRGAQVSPAYVVDPAAARRDAASLNQRDAPIPHTPANAIAKIADGDSVWHRLGDVGYFDEQARFWYCGRKAHRVTTAAGVMFTIPIEAQFNTHAAVRRAALVGVGSPGAQTPIVCIEPAAEFSARAGGDFASASYQDLAAELAPLAKRIGVARILFHPGFPVDVRHNAKIRREELAAWATLQLQG
ncbi:MAG: AMP-binding protein, partial [Planctomycetales bacterium]|nr:AMP-binding protein [Planctomycetales bacterium]